MQRRITVEDDRETIKRFSHIKPARGWRTALCSVERPGAAHACTLARGHRGPHVAHGFFKNVVAVWYSGTEARASGESLRRVSKAREGSGLRTRKPVGVLAALWGRVRTFSSLEEVALLILFLAFVGFAIDWLLLILG